MKLLSDEHYIVDFKLDTNTFGCLHIDRFQRTKRDCQEIQENGHIYWQSKRYKINKERTVFLHDRKYCMFITELDYAEISD